MIFPPKYLPGEIVYFDGTPNYKVIVGKIKYANHDGKKWVYCVDGYGSHFPEHHLYRLGDDTLTPIAF